jgi:two-component system cell cycle response regulator DivK
MAYAFNGLTFGQIIEDAYRLLALAREQEQELTSLAGVLEDYVVVPASAAGMAVATTQASLEMTAASELVEGVDRLRLSAVEQRRSAEAMLARLIGYQAGDGVARTRPRLLIVDDSDSNRETTAAILEDAGFDVLTATNGLEGVIVAHYLRPSVILMDLTMPVLNGLEAARLIRASSATQDLKVIAYTARPDLFDGSMKKWFDDVILKPSGPEAIVALVRRLTASERRA